MGGRGHARTSVLPDHPVCLPRPTLCLRRQDVAREPRVGPHHTGPGAGRGGWCAPVGIRDPGGAAALRLRGDVHLEQHRGRSPSLEPVSSI